MLKAAGQSRLNSRTICPALNEAPATGLLLSHFFCLYYIVDKLPYLVSRNMILAQIVKISVTAVSSRQDYTHNTMFALL